MTEDLKRAIEKLATQGWKADNKKIGKVYGFDNFADALGFMVRMSFEIEKRDHHPEWTNVYNKITVKLTTHDAGSVTMKDVELAGIMDKIAAVFIATE